jgi:hypothetical protein
MIRSEMTSLPSDASFGNIDGADHKRVDCNRAYSGYFAPGLNRYLGTAGRHKRSISICRSPFFSGAKEPELSVFICPPRLR